MNLDMFRARKKEKPHEKVRHLVGKNVSYREDGMQEDTGKHHRA
jgi:hypothetical protein